MWVPESGLASSYRASIYYEVYGEGPCVLFVPGGFETHLAYWKNVPAFVQAGYRVITTNLRGHFQSPCAPQDLDFRHHARDIESVLDRERIEAGGGTTAACCSPRADGLHRRCLFAEQLQDQLQCGRQGA
jgi:pimeloyl-ACP methyl ester carboxylesterase